ncbi:hypothetical protein ACGFIF_25505 [Kribbella sp. NPDC049174]|uniref:hypothetical protein n=1 Tax=Kribbella sp. NPDC049174 TaxID=3364112 RepID=UPI003713462B
MSEVWTDELRRTGRVVFPVRRLTVVVRCFVPAVAIGVLTVVSLNQELTLGTPETVQLVAGIVIVAALVGVGVWQLATGRPAITIDREGIRAGRRKLIPWNEIGPIPAPHAQGPLTTLQVHRKLTITRDNVRDIQAFALWLEAQRATNTP